ncbi:peroxidase P7-like [Phragmites australis]|uniref:peroxidase P7-like n=1 Tax=Phragmites australis TaxID=29695 RepID=UPI002D778589|nr:peroxidase P7-like [Phragmites australis]
MASSIAGHCFLLALFLFFSATHGQLKEDFYAKTCPSLDLKGIVRNELSRVLPTDRRMGASLLRLFFHDCFVQGCDASVLLDNDKQRGIVSEKDAGPNKNSLRGFKVIDDIKTAVEASCSRVVSCADILAVTAREAVVALGGPSWTVLLGRRDSMNGSPDKANSDLPSPDSDLSTLITAFGNKGLSPRDLTALSGAHTIGFSQCQNFRGRIYNDANINSTFATLRKANCPAMPGIGDSNLAPLDEQTQLVFDNKYYGNLVVRRGLLHSDQELFNGGSQDQLVRDYSSDPTLFRTDFANAMKKMSEISPLTGVQGQIRVKCSSVNIK